MNNYSIFIVVVLILAISHQGRSAETPLIDFFQKLVCPFLKKDVLK